MDLQQTNGVGVSCTITSVCEPFGCFMRASMTLLSFTHGIWYILYFYKDIKRQIRYYGINKIFSAHKLHLCVFYCTNDRNEQLIIHAIRIIQFISTHWCWNHVYLHKRLYIGLKKETAEQDIHLTDGQWTQQWINCSHHAQRNISFRTYKLNVCKCYLWKQKAHTWMQNAHVGYVWADSGASGGPTSGRFSTEAPPPCSWTQSWQLLTGEEFMRYLNQETHRSQLLKIKPMWISLPKCLFDSGTQLNHRPADTHASPTGMDTHNQSSPKECIIWSSIRQSFWRTYHATVLKNRCLWKHLFSGIVIDSWLLLTSGWAWSHYQGNAAWMELHIDTGMRWKYLNGHKVHNASWQPVIKQEYIIKRHKSRWYAMCLLHKTQTCIHKHNFSHSNVIVDKDVYFSVQ